MAFRLSRRHSIPVQLGRIARREIDAALDELDRRALDRRAIHEARKSVKKVRAVLRLLRDALGRRYAKENQRLRRSARALASLRDADASVDTLHALRLRYPTIVTPAVARVVRRGLKRRKRRLAPRAQARLGHAKGALRRSKTVVPRLVRRFGKRKAVVSGAVRTYRRARRALRDLEVDSAAAQFHEWRKRVKDHRYHLRLFRGRHPGARGRAETVERLDGLLGDDHDLAMLQAILLDDSGSVGTARKTGLVLGGIARRRDGLRRRALTIGRRTFAARPPAFEGLARRWSRGPKAPGKR